MQQIIFLSLYSGIVQETLVQPITYNRLTALEIQTFQTAFSQNGWTSINSNSYYKSGTINTWNTPGGAEVDIEK